MKQLEDEEEQQSTSATITTTTATTMALSYCRPMLDILRRVTVEPVLLFFMFASFLTFSAFMALVYDKTCLSIYNSSLCHSLQDETFAKKHQSMQDSVQTQSSHWIMISNVAMTVPATLSLLLWMGSLGDRVGRRLPLLIPCVGGLLYSVCNLLNARFLSASPALLMIGPVMSGFSGSYLAVLMATYTYLTHASGPERRMVRVGFAEASTYIAGTISVFVSGKLVDTLGYVPVFAIALSCQAVAVGYTLFILPDIKPTETIQDVTEQRAACCKGVCLNPVRDMWTFLNTPREKSTKIHLALMIVVIDILQLCTTGEGDILLLYLKRSPRNWSYTKYGYFSGATNATRSAAVLLLLPLLKKITSLQDTILILVGLASKLAGLIILGLATQEWLIFFVVAVGALQGFPSAGLRASMAGLVEKQEQGRMFGVVAATEGIVTFCSTLLFNGLYPVTLDLYDGLCFHLMAAFTIVCLMIVLWQHSDFTSGYIHIQESADTPEEQHIRS